MRRLAAQISVQLILYLLRDRVPRKVDAQTEFDSDPWNKSGLQVDNTACLVYTFANDPSF